LVASVEHQYLVAAAQKAMHRLLLLATPAHLAAAEAVGLSMVSRG
jgi:hypothetical protein